MQFTPYLNPSLLVTSLTLLLNQSPASAQQTNATSDSPGDTQLDTITVTGYRYSIEQSLEQKRAANAVVEVVTAEDISKFPIRTSPIRCNACLASSSIATAAKARRSAFAD